MSDDARAKALKLCREWWKRRNDKQTHQIEGSTQRTTGLVCIALATRHRWTYLHLGIGRPKDWFFWRRYEPFVGEYEWGLGPVFVLCWHGRPFGG